MNIFQINDGIYYVGINDLSSTVFESLWSLPAGVTYNSYIVKGEKTALIDTVPAAEAPNLVRNIKDMIGDSPVDYLIINHMEPDHSGAIEYIKQVYPNITIVGNAITLQMLNGYYGVNTNVRTVKDGEDIDLGGDMKLRFIMTPMLHWPETMMTYEIKSGTLFSGDAFGAFGALNGAITDKEADIEAVIPEVFRYYAAVVAKYGRFVQKALEKLKGNTINTICSTHGPVWKHYIMHIIDLYDRLSKYEAERGIVIAYSSMYGHTANIAELLARVFILKGVTVKLHNLEKSDLSAILADAIRYKGIIIGSPNYNGNIFPTAQTLVNAIVAREFKNRAIAAFGTYSWTRGVGEKILASFKDMDVTTLPQVLEMKCNNIEQIENNIEAYADNFISLL